MKGEKDERILDVAWFVDFLLLIMGKNYWEKLFFKENQIGAILKTKPKNLFRKV